MWFKKRLSSGRVASNNEGKYPWSDKKRALCEWKETGVQEATLFCFGRGEFDLKKRR